MASSVSMLDADRVCSSDRGVVSHLSMPPLVRTACASNLFFFLPPPPPFYRAFFAKLKPHLLPGVQNGKVSAPTRWSLYYLQGGLAAVWGARRRWENLHLSQWQHGLHSGRGREKWYEADANSTAAWCEPFSCCRVPGISHWDEISVNIPGKMQPSSLRFPAPVPGCAIRLTRRELEWSDNSQRSARASLRSY